MSSLTASVTSTLTITYRCHPRASTLVVTRYHDRMIFLYRNELCHWLIKDLATWTTWKRRINRWCWNHDRNICWMLWSSLLGYTWLSISLEIRRMVRRLISILKLGLSSVNLEGMTSVFLQLRKIRANHLGSNFHPGTKAQSVHHAIQISRQ